MKHKDLYLHVLNELILWRCYPEMQALSLQLGLFRTMSNKTFFLPTRAFAKVQTGYCLWRGASGCLFLTGSPLPMLPNYISPSQCPLLHLVSWLSYLGGVQSVKEKNINIIIKMSFTQTKYIIYNLLLYDSYFAHVLLFNPCKL